MACCTQPAALQAHPDHSCGELVHRCWQHIFHIDHHSAVFSRPLTEMAKINPLPKGISNSSRDNTGTSIPQMK